LPKIGTTADLNVPEAYSISSLTSFWHGYLLGHTMHLRQLSVFYPPAAALATQLGATTTGFWHVALAVSPPNADDYPTHNHFSDQIVLQLAGQSRWTLSNATQDAPDFMTVRGLQGLRPTGANAKLFVSNFRAACVPFSYS